MYCVQVLLILSRILCMYLIKHHLCKIEIVLLCALFDISGEVVLYFVTWNIRCATVMYNDHSPFSGTSNSGFIKNKWYYLDVITRLLLD